MQAVKRSEPTGRKRRADGYRQPDGGVPGARSPKRAGSRKASRPARRSTPVADAARAAPAPRARGVPSSAGRTRSHTRDDVRSEAPIYVWMADELREAIRSGKYGPGDRLPSERALAARYRVARMTAREALMLLQATGLVYREDRRGCFVAAPRLRYDPRRHVNTFRLIASAGREARGVVLDRSRLPATDTLARLLGCAGGELTYLVRSITELDGRRVCYEENHLLASAVPRFLEREYWEPITDFLREAYRVRTEQVGFRARSVGLHGLVAKTLGVAPGTPGWFLCRIKKARGEARVVQVDHDFWLADALEIATGRVPDLEDRPGSA